LFYIFVVGFDFASNSDCPPRAVDKHCLVGDELLALSGSFVSTSVSRIPKMLVVSRVSYLFALLTGAETRDWVLN
jgi:hypothetical protein